MLKFKLFFHTLRPGRLAAVCLFMAVTGLSLPAVAQYEDYEGSDWCARCHEYNWNQWQASGHPYKLMKAEEARNRPIPLPEGYRWDDISYVIGGYKWKSRYLDKDGYIITVTGFNLDEPGNNQYNYMTGEWVDYNPGEEDLPYNCGQCHTTAWIPDEDPSTPEGKQDGLDGIWGTFFAGGVHCEQCHGPGFDSMEVDTSAEACGECHVRGDPNTIPASGGFIRHHQQYNEHLAGAHGRFDCTRCHNPHEKAEFSIWEAGERVYDGTGGAGRGAQCGVDCHSRVRESYEKTRMYDYGVECKDCHMPFASKSAAVLGPHQGDVMTHIFRIDTDPAANMFTEDGSFVKLDDNGKARVTMDFACQRCHVTASLDELALYAKDFHDENKGLEDIGLDPGLTGTWWNEDRSGEGFEVQVGYYEGVMTFFGTFYTYDAAGNQVWLTLEQGSIEGNTAHVRIFSTDSAVWGDDFDPADVNRLAWGSGSVEFPTCTSANVVLTPNAAMKDLGFTDQAYPLTRTLDSGSRCPTFVNNEMTAVAAAK